MRDITHLVVGVLSIGLGGTVYALFREDTLLMFSWFEQLGLSNLLTEMREIRRSLPFTFPEYFYFSMPNALWSFGGLLVISSVWGSCSTERIVWQCGFAVLALSFEVGQLVHILPGTFDFVDLSQICVSIGLALQISRIYEGEKEHVVHKTG